MSSHQIIVRPLHTEKSVDDMRATNTYHFEVSRRASKSQIRHAVEEIFPGCKVKGVRTMRVKGKMRRVGWNVGRTSEWKKAIVQLRTGDNIDIGY
ncbi:MAG: 50S ribosomal protein L23 [Planctomycetes bacterium]|nr:50S ribosomal protein L23 [Planctomycetota bacterium]